MHLHDYKDDSIHPLPFDGITDWSEIIRRIKETNYAGAIAIEAMNWNYKDISPEKYMQFAFDSAEKLENLIC